MTTRDGGTSLPSHVENPRRWSLLAASAHLKADPSSLQEPGDCPELEKVQPPQAVVHPIVR